MNKQMRIIDIICILNMVPGMADRELNNTASLNDLVLGREFLFLIKKKNFDKHTMWKLIHHSLSIWEYGSLNIS